MALSKSLSDNSKICVIMGLASVDFLFLFKLIFSRVSLY